MSPYPVWLVRGCRLAWIMAFLGVIFVSLRPLPPGMDIPGGDKLAHLLTYMVLAITFPWVLTRKQTLVLFVFLVLTGGILEGLQSVMALGRSGELADCLANGAGVLLGCAVRSLKQHAAKD